MLKLELLNADVDDLLGKLDQTSDPVRRHRLVLSAMLAVASQALDGTVGRTESQYLVGHQLLQHAKNYDIKAIEVRVAPNCSTGKAMLSELTNSLKLKAPDVRRRGAQDNQPFIQTIKGDQARTRLDEDPSFVADAKGEVAKRGECIYCHQKIGQEHSVNCSYISRGGR